MQRATPKKKNPPGNNFFSINSLDCRCCVLSQLDVGKQTILQDETSQASQETREMGRASDVSTADPAVAAAARAILQADYLLVTAGAGMSADSKLPVYRDIARVDAYKTAGLDYQDLCDPVWIRKDPAVFFGFWGKCLNDYMEARHHAGYGTVADLCELVARRAVSDSAPSFVYTSNVDCAFRRNGRFDPTRIYEIHGNLKTWQCSRPCCDSVWELPDDFRFEVDLKTMRAPRQRKQCGETAPPHVAAEAVESTGSVIACAARPAAPACPSSGPTVVTLLCAAAPAASEGLHSCHVHPPTEPKGLSSMRSATHFRPHSVSDSEMEPPSTAIRASSNSARSTVFGSRLAGPPSSLGFRLSGCSLPSFAMEFVSAAANDRSIRLPTDLIQPLAVLDTRCVAAVRVALEQPSARLGGAGPAAGQRSPSSTAVGIQNSLLYPSYRVAGPKTVPKLSFEMDLVTGMADNTTVAGNFRPALSLLDFSRPLKVTVDVSLRHRTDDSETSAIGIVGPSAHSTGTIRFQGVLCIPASVPFDRVDLRLPAAADRLAGAPLLGADLVLRIVRPNPGSKFSVACVGLRIPCTVFAPTPPLAMQMDRLSMDSPRHPSEEKGEDSHRSVDKTKNFVYCPKCGAIARPNVLMFDDDCWIDVDDRHYRSWRKNVVKEMTHTGVRKRLVILELGCGLRVPTVREHNEALLKKLGDIGATLIRINMEFAANAKQASRTISIKAGCLEALQKIAAAVDVLQAADRGRPLFPAVAAVPRRPPLSAVPSLVRSGKVPAGESKSSIRQLQQQRERAAAAAAAAGLPYPSGISAD